MQVVSEQVKTNAQVETDVYKIMNHMDMMDKIREMSKELGKAVENFGLVQADIEKVEKEINAINAKKATLEANLARLGEEKGRIAEIMKSEPHRRARELMIKIRDEDI